MGELLICRYENTQYNTVLVIDECSKFLGECTVDAFVDAMDERDSFLEDEYDFYFIDKSKLSFAFKSFSNKKLNK